MDDLVTVGTYWTAVEAHLARNRLEEAGIPAHLTGEELVSMTWHLANAVGGVRVCVAPADLERALACLAEPTAPGGDEAEEPTEPGPEEDDDDGDEPATTADGSLPGPDDPPGPREEWARRALLAAVFGLLFFPIQFYAAYLLLRVLTDDEPMRPRYTRSAWLAAAILVPNTLAWWVILRPLSYTSRGE